MNDDELIAPVSADSMSKVADAGVDSADITHTLDGADTLVVSANTQRSIPTKLLHKSSGITVPISHYGASDTSSNSDGASSHDLDSQDFASTSSNDQARKSTTIASQSTKTTSHPNKDLQTSKVDHATVSSSSLTTSVQRERQ